jgi:hypothetical protein
MGGDRVGIGYTLAVPYSNSKKQQQQQQQQHAMLGRTGDGTTPPERDELFARRVETLGSRIRKHEKELTE